MKPELRESRHKAGYIEWYLVEEDEAGAFVGAYARTREEIQSKIDGALSMYTNAGDAAYLEDMIEFYFVELAALELAQNDPAKITRGEFGWFYADKATVRFALRALKRAHKSGTDYARSTASLPTWAIQAKAAGWTPPKGWKP